MKCPHCNGEHPDNFKFCPETGVRIEPQLKACTNKDCPDYGKLILPLEAKFCPRCGKQIGAAGNVRSQKKRHEVGHSQIVVVCSGVGSFIQIGKRVGHVREKRIRLWRGENVISVKKYPELQYGFSFNKDDNPEQIENIVLDQYDTSNVTDMKLMFTGCSSLKSLDLSGFDTSKVTDMRFMFWDCSSLKSLDLSGFDTSKVTDMGSMFAGCSSLESLDLSGFDTSNVTDMWSMFRRCTSLKSLDLSGFDTSSVTNMRSMFDGCTSLKSLDLSGFDTSKVTNMIFMFDGCPIAIQNRYRGL